MSRRISQRRREGFSEVIATHDTVDVNDQEVLCNQDIRHGIEPRKLIYRRLRGMENAFDGSWPATTHIHCWYCRLAFTTVPIPVVQQYDSTKKLYDVYGITCSPSCSKSYIMNMRNNDARTRLMWQTKMIVDVFGWPHDKPIPVANPWQALDVFGGYMTVEDWRKNRPGITMQIKMPPFVPFHVYTETEIKGICHIDQTQAPETMDRVDSLEEQAIQHGAAFSLKGLQRPEKTITTLQQLKEVHPHHNIDIHNSGSVFLDFLKNQPVPDDAECQNIRDQREAERKAKRKRKKAVVAGPASTASMLDDTTALPPAKRPASNKKPTALKSSETVAATVAVDDDVAAADDDIGEPEKTRKPLTTRRRRKANDADIE
jgi:hypothetical protein